MWFVYDIDSGFDIFENEDEANVWLNKKLEEYREDAVGEEWNVDVESLCMGKVTKMVTLVPVDGVDEFYEAIVEDVNE